MKNRIIIVVIAAVLGVLGVMTVTYAITWGGIKCLYNPACTTGPSTISDNTNKGVS